MSRTELPFNPAEYALVAERIELLYQRFPTGRILTELVSRTASEITFRACVYRYSNKEEPIAATGWASERPGDGDVNSVACLENTETSAIGRALANLGFTASRKRPSYEEMLKARRSRSSLVSEPASARPIARERAELTSAVRPLDTPLQRHANELTDVLSILAIAERLGFPADRAGSLRERLRAWPPPSEPSLDRLHRAIRGWLDRREHPARPSR